MGRRTLSNPQFKDRRGVDLRAQVFALRRALAVKAQLVKNQQRQIDLLGRELANACIRIAALEQHKARAEAAWERISDLAVSQAATCSTRYDFPGELLDQVTADALRTGAGAFSLVVEHLDLAPPSDGVFDARLHEETQ